MQSPFGGHREAAGFGDGDEVAQVPEFHGRLSSHACQAWRPAYKVFFTKTSEAYFVATQRQCGDFGRAASSIASIPVSHRSSP
jgi:hypothetical protein